MSVKEGVRGMISKFWCRLPDNDKGARGSRRRRKVPGAAACLPIHEWHADGEEAVKS